MANLTTLAAVKAYLGIVTAGQDTLIPTLIARESALVEQWCGRKFSYTLNSKRLNGSNTKMLVLPETPILSVSALSIQGSVIAASSDAIQSGFVFDDNCLYLVGDWLFIKGNQNIECSWTTGYETTETAYVPTGNTPTITPTTGGTALSAVSVTDTTSSVVLTQVGANPATGQYSFAAGVFTFNSAQYNHSVTMRYYYVPSPVEQAVIEMVGLDLQQRSNIGISSKSLAGESVTYGIHAMTPSAMELLMPFRVRQVA